MTKIGLKEFRQDVEKYARKAKEGEVVVFKRSKALFRVAPLEEDPWEEIIDFTKIQTGGINIDDLLARL
jgi:antitoxin (DNA-binding transcriptional repressor) of toxin-antitoxin stability system